jgi:AcrR family transcriptional regulator
LKLNDIEVEKGCVPMPKSGLRVILLEQVDAPDDGVWECDMYTRTDILNTACALFSERGYRGTTVRDIARALDLKEGSLYSHIKSKEDMLWEIVNRLANLFLASASFVPQDLPYDEQLTLLVRGHLDVITHEQHAAMVFFREGHLLPSEQRERLQEKRSAYEAYFYHVLAAGKLQGLFRFFDTRLTTLFLLSSLNGAYQWLAWAEPQILARVKQQYEVFLLHTLKGG